MREHVKVEVAIEILSICVAIAISNNDNETLNDVLRLRKLVFQGNEEAINESINRYGKTVKNVLEENNE